MKVYNKFVESKKEPYNKNDIWFDGSSWKMYKEGVWRSFTLPIELAKDIEDTVKDLDLGNYLKKTDVDSTLSETSINPVGNKVITERLNTLWENLDHGTFPNLTAGDLAGRGESVPAEFGFRVSGGKSIKDGRAYIKRIKGNSVVWNQSIEGLNLNDGARIIKGHMYLMGADFGNAPDSSSVSLYCKNEGANVIAFSIFKSTPCVIATSAYSGVAPTDAWIYTYVEGEANITNLHLIDLTQMFGAGYEPTTIEEYEARKPIVADEYAYNEGEVVNMKATGIKSVGFNAWDEQWELGVIGLNGDELDSTTHIRSKNFNRLMSGQSYNILCPDNAGQIILYDEDKNFVDYFTLINRILEIPANVRFFKLTFASTYGTTYKNDICINLDHSGYRNGEYEPYVEDVVALPTLDLFPNGMNKIGEVYDEYDEEKSVQRIGSVDLGDMAWSYDSANQVFTSYTIMDLMTHPAEVSERNKGLLCSKYSPSRTYVASTMDDKSWLRIPKSVTIKDSSYTDAATFKEAMQGVMLFYELAEPIVTEITEDFRDYYQVADFGTEQSQSAVPSAAFSADIIYQFNAVDMIREHEAEITELQKVIATMQAQMASLTSK